VATPWIIRSAFQYLTTMPMYEVPLLIEMDNAVPCEPAFRRTPRSRRARCGSAEITERSNRFTESEESNTCATSGSSTTATAFSAIREANLFGRLFV
jgi:hypothetical protein